MKPAIVLKNSRGFTTIELLVASAVMLVIVTAVFALYLPGQRSNRTEIDIADVQANLRLALDQISKDVRMAGFLVDGDAIDQSTAPTATSFTIRTTTAARRYARIISQDAGNKRKFHIFTESMVDRFAVGDKVRVIRPPNQDEPDPGVFTVSAVDNNAADPTITLADSSLTTAYASGDMIVRTTANANVVNTVRYTYDAGSRTLRRVTNEGTADEVEQILVRNLSVVQFSYVFNDDGDISRVGIVLTGATEADPAGKFPERSRTVRTSVSLRNV